MKNHLIRRGVEFVSDTDTEVVAQMLEYYYKGDVLETIQKVISKVEGSYALGILCADCPDKLYAVRKDSPLIIGIGQGQNYIASDVPAILSYTRDIYRLKDQEIAVLTRDAIDFYNQDLEPVEKEAERVQWDIDAAEKGGYEHFMMKEICAQPEALRKTISPRIRDGKIVLDNITLTKEQIQDLRKVFIVACGTSYHVGVVAKYAFERLLKIPLEVDVASEFRYRDPILDEENAGHHHQPVRRDGRHPGALRMAKKRGCRILSSSKWWAAPSPTRATTCCTPGRARRSPWPPTKAYSTQLAVIYMIALYMADQLGTVSAEDMAKYMDDLQKAPRAGGGMSEGQGDHPVFRFSVFQRPRYVLYRPQRGLRRVLEASLKLKEISYIHSEAYTAGELKHGPISLLEDGTLVIAIATYQKLFDKMMSNVREVKARGAVGAGHHREGEGGGPEAGDGLPVLRAGHHRLMLPSLSILAPAAVRLLCGQHEGLRHR